MPTQIMDAAINSNTHCRHCHQPLAEYRRKSDGGLAFGHYQIHIDKHPVSYDCAMDFECSRDYTRRMILAGKGWLWTSYDNCL